MIARDCALAAVRGRADPRPAPLGAPSRSRRSSAAKADGVEVTCEATPHHLTLTDEEVRSLDSRFKMNPPLRTEDDRQALIEALRSGTIDCIATDHAPHPRDEKEVPFEQAAMGVTGLETAFAVLYTELVLPGVLDLATLVERLGARRRAVRLRARRGSRRAPRRTSTLCRPRRRVGGRRRGLGEPLGQLLLRRPPAAAAGC